MPPLFKSVAVVHLPGIRLRPSTCASCPTAAWSSTAASMADPMTDPWAKPRRGRRGDGGGQPPSARPGRPHPGGAPGPPPIPQDGHPIIGFAAVAPNLYVAAMHSGVTLLRWWANSRPRKSWMGPTSNLGPLSSQRLPRTEARYFSHPGSAWILQKKVLYKWPKLMYPWVPTVYCIQYTVGVLVNYPLSKESNELGTSPGLVRISKTRLWT